MVVVVDVFDSDDAGELRQGQVFIRQQLHLAELRHVVDQHVALLEGVGMVVDALDEALGLVGLAPFLRG